MHLFDQTRHEPTHLASPRNSTDGRRLRGRAEAGVGLLLACSALIVHDVGYMLSAPFWVDEAWVAVSTRAPLGQLGRITSTTPIPSDRTIAMTNRLPVDVSRALAQALGLARRDDSARLWIVLSHEAASEAVAWDADLAPLHPQGVVVSPGTILRYVVIGPQSATG
jgi:hypothetical protein